MATYIQQYNPWRENLAVNVLSGIINHIQENERNKKANAFLGQLTQNLSANRQGNLLTPQNEPEGYNSSPWAQAFHQNNNPLTQFDFGTNGIIPQKPFSTAEILNEAANLAATKRFSSMNTQAVRDLITPYLQANEQARLEDLRNQFANDFLNAGSNADKINQLVSGGIRQIIPESFMNNAFNIYRPQPYTQNYGGEVRRGNIDLNGQFHDQDIIPITPTQAELAALAGQASQHANTQNENYINGQLADLDAQIKLRTDRIAQLQEAAQNADPKAVPAINSTIDQLSQEVQALYQQKAALRSSFYFPQQGNQSNYQAQPSQVRQSSRIPQNIHSLINKYAAQFSQKYGVTVEPELIQAILLVESGGKNSAVSNKGAQGLMQLIPSTARMLGVTDPFDPEQNIRGGVEYFAQMLKQYGSIEKALWAYNAGPRRVNENYMPNETREYIPKILSIYRSIKQQEQPVQNTQTIQATQPVQPTQNTQNTQATQTTQPAQNTAPSRQIPNNAVLVHDDGSFITLDDIEKMRVAGNTSADDIYRQLEDKGYYSPTDMKIPSMPSIPSVPEISQTTSQAFSDFWGKMPSRDEIMNALSSMPRDTTLNRIVPPNTFTRSMTEGGQLPVSQALSNFWGRVPSLDEIMNALSNLPSDATYRTVPHNSPWPSVTGGNQPPVSQALSNLWGRVPSWNEIINAVSNMTEGRQPRISNALTNLPSDIPGRTVSSDSYIMPPMIGGDVMYPMPEGAQTTPQDWSRFSYLSEILNAISKMAPNTLPPVMYPTQYYFLGW